MDSIKKQQRNEALIYLESSMCILVIIGHTDLLFSLIAIWIFFLLMYY